jgi:adenylylsulfate kinase
MMQTRGVTIWLTGLSGAGKSTISALVADFLRQANTKVEVLDGDEVRQVLSSGLGFSRADRDMNIRRIGFVSRLLSRNGVIAIAAAISPYREVREELRQTIPDFLEVFIDCPLQTCIHRDVKGLYAKAIRGEISSFTGISDPYEPPLNPDLIIRSDQETPEVSAKRVLQLLSDRGYLQLHPDVAHSAIQQTSNGQQAHQKQAVRRLSRSRLRLLSND